MIYTTYFAKLRSMPKHIQPYVISRTAPPGVKLPTIPVLAPPIDVFARYKQTGDWSAFSREYLEHLNTVDPAVLEGLDDVALVCWEKEPAHCHRSLAGAWVSDVLGVPVKEWGCDC